MSVPTRISAGTCNCYVAHTFETHVSHRITLPVYNSGWVRDGRGVYVDDLVETFDPAIRDFDQPWYACAPARVAHSRFAWRLSPAARVHYSARDMYMLKLVPAVPRSSLKIYQEKLGAAWDNSVTILAVGHLTVLLELLESPGGAELVATKVKKMVVMGDTLSERDVPEWVSGAIYSWRRPRVCVRLRPPPPRPSHRTHTAATRPTQ